MAPEPDVFQLLPASCGPIPLGCRWIRLPCSSPSAGGPCPCRCGTRRRRWRRCRGPGGGGWGAACWQAQIQVAFVSVSRETQKATLRRQWVCLSDSCWGRKSDKTQLTPQIWVFIQPRCCRRLIGWADFLRLWPQRRCFLRDSAAGCLVRQNPPNVWRPLTWQPPV